MGSYIFLSYPINMDTPAYGNGQTMEIEGVKEIVRGDSCNTSFWKLPNHTGTHVDFPKHFDPEGKSVDFYNADFWIFNVVHIEDISGNKSIRTVTENDICLDKIPAEVDLLLIKTGFCNIRGEVGYWKNSPVFSPKLAAALRSKFPLLRAIGIDSISISSLQDRELGRVAHREFLCSSRPILLIEDMDLCAVNGDTRLREVVVAPLRVSDTDGSPCTVFGEVDE